MGNKLKHLKELKRKYGTLAESMEEYYHHLDLRPLSDLTDEGLDYILARIKGVDMLDLNETEISNKGIQLLTRLEYLKELRVKGCAQLDNGCAEDLNKITSLELLHVKGTGISIDGLLKLDALPNLKKLLFSADDPEVIKEKIWELKERLPGCSFVINSKPYYFDALDYFLTTTKSLKVAYRLKISGEAVNDSWSNWIIKPTDSYIETEMQGPCPVNTIDWININPVENSQLGQRVPHKAIDHSKELLRLLEKLSLPYMVVDQLISIYVS